MEDEKINITIAYYDQKINEILNFMNSNNNKFSDEKITLKGEQRAFVDLQSLNTIWLNSGTRCNLSCANCYIESNCIIAAGAVLLENTRVEAWSIYAGVPAKKVKTLSPELFEGEVQRIASNYVMYSGWFKE